MAEFPQSREEVILQATINGEEYTGLPESRIEELLLELKAVIESGGGGGGTTNYNFLENKPQINSVTLVGNKTAAELNLVSQQTVESTVEDVLDDKAEGYVEDGIADNKASESDIDNLFN